MNNHEFQYPTVRELSPIDNHTYQLPRVNEVSRHAQSAPEQHPALEIHERSNIHQDPDFRVIHKVGELARQAADKPHEIAVQHAGHDVQIPVTHN